MKPCGLSKSSVQMSVVVYLQYDASISVPMALSALCNLLDFLAASPVSFVGGAISVVPSEFHLTCLSFQLVLPDLLIGTDLLTMMLQECSLPRDCDWWLSAVHISDVCTVYFLAF